jgi:anti-anti-sigma factor
MSDPDPRGGGTPPLPLQRFRVSSESRDGFAVIAVQGELDMHTALDLAPLLDEASAAEKRVVLDLSDCSFIDSTGIALVLNANRRLSDAGIESGMTLCGLLGQVRRVLEIAGVSAQLRVSPSRERHFRGSNRASSGPYR